MTSQFLHVSEHTQTRSNHGHFSQGWHRTSRVTDCTCLHSEWRGTWRCSSTRWCPGGWRRQNSRASACSSCSLESTSHSPMCKKSWDLQEYKNLSSKKTENVTFHHRAEMCFFIKPKTYSIPKEVPDSRPASRSKPWGWWAGCDGPMSIGWPAAVWWWRCSGRLKWPTGWSWTWFQTKHRRRRTSYNLLGKARAECKAWRIENGCCNRWIRGEPGKMSYPFHQTPIPYTSSWQRRWATGWRPWGSRSLRGLWWSSSAVSEASCY